MKKLILCCDGTWNAADQKTAGKLCPTNVIKLGLRVAKRDAQGVAQILYYHPGVGTGNWVDRLSGGAFGNGLEDNVYAVYQFLICNYEPGDQIFLFGFSRGAYTARSIAGMVRKCGIIRREYARRYVDAIALYRSGVHPNDDQACAFRNSCSVAGAEPIAIRCVGVWDTVGALGIPLEGLRSLTRQDYQFFDTELNGSVEYAFHALAIDEHRKPFTPTLWDYVPKPGQTVEQVWFCGAHSDVGGGYPESGLSDIALDWMLERVGSGGPGLALDAAVVGESRLAPDPLSKDLHDSRDGIFKLASGIDRAIGLAKTRDGASALDPRQRLHESVLARWDGLPGYRPVSLRNYFKLTGDARGAAS
ncbi:MAG: DUF2235 domain-containing protein [Nevskia sp.]